MGGVDVGEDYWAAVFFAVEDQEPALGRVGALVGQDDVCPKLTRADQRVTAARQCPCGRGGFDPAQLTDRQAPRLQKAVAGFPPLYLLVVRGGDPPFPPAVPRGE